MLSFKSGVSKGIIIAVVVSVAWKLFSLGAGIFLDVAHKCKSLLVAFGVSPSLAGFLSFAVMVAVVWTLGHIKPLEIIKYLLGKKAEKSERKYLFCVHIKNFLGGYPIGLVTKVRPAIRFACTDMECGFVWHESGEGIKRDSVSFNGGGMKCKKCGMATCFVLTRHLNIVFPNLGGMWTFIDIPEEDTERSLHNAEEILLPSMSAGFL